MLRGDRDPIDALHERYNPDCERGPVDGPQAPRVPRAPRPRLAAAIMDWIYDDPEAAIRLAAKFDDDRR